MNGFWRTMTTSLSQCEALKAEPYAPILIIGSPNSMLAWKDELDHRFNNRELTENYLEWHRFYTIAGSKGDGVYIWDVDALQTFIEGLDKETVSTGRQVVLTTLQAWRLRNDATKNEKKKEKQQQRSGANREDILDENDDKGDNVETAAQDEQNELDAQEDEGIGKKIAAEHEPQLVKYTSSFVTMWRHVMVDDHDNNRNNDRDDEEPVAQDEQDKLDA